MSLQLVVSFFFYISVTTPPYSNNSISYNPDVVFDVGELRIILFGWRKHHTHVVVVVVNGPKDYTTGRRIVVYTTAHNIKFYVNENGERSPGP